MLSTGGRLVYPQLIDTLHYVNDSVLKSGCRTNQRPATEPNHNRLRVDRGCRLRALRKISKTGCRPVTTGLFKAWIGKINHVYYDLSNTNCVLWLLHITFVAVRAYMVHEGGCGCCVHACVRVGMGMRMRRLARR